jgi:hypothetical protein
MLYRPDPVYDQTISRTCMRFGYRVSLIQYKVRRMLVSNMIPTMNADLSCCQLRSLGLTECVPTEPHLL